MSLASKLYDEPHADAIYLAQGQEAPEGPTSLLGVASSRPEADIVSLSAPPFSLPYLSWTHNPLVGNIPGSIERPTVIDLAAMGPGINEYAPTTGGEPFFSHPRLARD